MTRCATCPRKKQCRLVALPYRVMWLGLACVQHEACVLVYVMANMCMHTYSNSSLTNITGPLDGGCMSLSTLTQIAKGFLRQMAQPFKQVSIATLPLLPVAMVHVGVCAC